MSHDLTPCPHGCGASFHGESEAYKRHADERVESGTCPDPWVQPLGEVGDRVRAVHFFYEPGKTSIDDNITVPPGTEGTIVFIDGLKSRAVKWDNGSSISLLPDCDVWVVL